MQRNEQVSEFKEKLVAVNRVSKTVKGGRNMRFSALMVVGDEKGRVGCGMGKAVEIPEAIRKGTEDAKKSMITVPMKGTTIPHEVVGVFGNRQDQDAARSGRYRRYRRRSGSCGSRGRAASRISSPSRSVPTIRSTWCAPPSPVSVSFAAPSRLPSFAARPLKSCWVKGVSES